MGTRYSYDDFTTRGHGVIEYADPYSSQDGQKKPKRRRKTNSKLATRWPSAAPLKRKPTPSTTISKKSVEKRAWEVFKKRYPGQQPKKGQIKQIMKELGPKPQKAQTAKAKPAPKIRSPRPESTLDKLASAMFAKRHPGKQPKKDQLIEIKREIAEARKKLGL